MIFDPVTAELLGTRQVVVEAQYGLDVGTVISSDSTVVTVVDAAPAPSVLADGHTTAR